MIKKAIVIATTGYSTPQQIAFNEVGRKAIISDPDWNNGDLLRETGSHTRPCAGTNGRPYHVSL